MKAATKWVVAGAMILSNLSITTASAERVSPNAEAAPSLLKDIVASPASALEQSSSSATLNNKIFFARTGDDDWTSWGLWMSDGSEAGTSLVPGTLGAFPERLTAFNGFVYFTMNSGLWRTDGTSTTEISGGPSAFSTELTVAGNALFFVGYDADENSSLWTTTGTTATEVPGTANSSPRSLVAVGNTVYFSAEDDTAGAEIWKSDGTTTSRIADINPGADHSDPANLTVVGSTVFFVATNGVAGRELWKTNGTLGGTVQVANISNGATSSSLSALTAVGSSLFFRYFNESTDKGELWVSDGTEGGTGQVPGTTSLSYVWNLTQVGSRLYFVDDVETGLWVSDGTQAGTSMVQGTSNFYPGNLTASGNTLYFAGTGNSAGQELWKASGANATQVADINPGANDSHPRVMATVGTTVFLNADTATYGRELWKTNSTTDETALVKDINVDTSGSWISKYVVAGSMLFFVSNGKAWKSDGTTAGTVRVPGTDALHAFSGYIAAGETVYMYADDASENPGLWRTDGTTTALVPGTSGLVPRNLVAIGSTIFFNTTDALWKTDGTTTTRLSSVTPQNNNEDAVSVVVANNQLFYVGYTDASGYELWKTDGTTTSQVADINPGAASSVPSNPTAVGNTVYFRATNGTNGYELWKTDGTTTSQVADINPGTGSSFPLYLTAIGNSIFFNASNGITGFELWRTDGTTTALVADINPGSADSEPYALTAVGDKLYFTAQDNTAGYELWTSDGSSAARVADLHPGSSGSDPSQMVVFGDRLVFTALTPGVGREPWVYDIPRVDDVLTWAPTLSHSVTSSPLTFSAASSKIGATVTYTVSDAGTTGCAIADQKVNVLTFTAAGSCSVTARTGNSVGYRGASATVTFVISGVEVAAPTTPPTTAPPTKTLPVLTAKKPVTIKALLNFFGVKAPKKSTISLSVKKSSTKVCETTKSGLKYLKPGRCAFTLKVQPPASKSGKMPKPIKRSAVVVSQKKL